MRSCWFCEGPCRTNVRKVKYGPEVCRWLLLLVARSCFETNNGWNPCMRLESWATKTGRLLMVSFRTSYIWLKIGYSYKTVGPQNGARTAPIVWWLGYRLNGRGIMVRFWTARDISPEHRTGCGAQRFSCALRTAGSDPKGQAAGDVALTAHLHVVATLRKCGGLRPMHHVPSWRDP
jgi:hypothetical protein